MRYLILPMDMFSENKKIQLLIIVMNFVQLLVTQSFEQYFVLPMILFKTTVSWLRYNRITSTKVVKFCMGGRFCSLGQLYKKFWENDELPSPKLNEDQKQEKGLRRKLKSFFPEIR